MMYKKFTITFLSVITVLVAAAQQQLKLWYQQPAVKWTEALPLGNGRIGAMVFGGVQLDRIQFNEETLWTGEPRAHNKKGAYKYLSAIRQLLFDGKQEEAEKLAAEQFMGLKSNEGNRAKWLKNVQALQGVKGNPAAYDFDDNHWKEMQVPSYEGWEAIGYEGLDGAIWFRTTFDLPANWQGKDLVLDLNRIREFDRTYVNGKLVGSMEGTDPRQYTIPKNVLRKGKNVIAIQVINLFDKGGIAGYKDTSRHIGVYAAGTENTKISLVKNWKYWVQNDEPPAVPRFQADYQPFGDLHLQFDHAAPSNYKRELDINNALVRTTYAANGVHYTREYLASQPAQALAVHIAADKRGSVAFTAALSSPHKNFVVNPGGGNAVILQVKVRNGALHGAAHLTITTTNGSVTIEKNKIVVNNADDVTIYLTAATNYKNYKDVSAKPLELSKSNMLALQGKSYQQVRDEHIKEYQQYFNKFSIGFGLDTKANVPTDERLRQFASSYDPAFMAVYTQYGRYLLIASSRPGTRPANLQGIWNDMLTPPWGSKYTTNINAEMNYWPAELLNLSPMHQPLFGMIKDLSEAGKVTAKQYYNAPGWLVHHNTDIWRGTAAINAANHGIWVTGGAWLSHHLWEHYLFTQNKKFLRDTAYPILKAASQFFTHFLVKDPKTGWLVSTPSSSPEQGGLVAGPTMDHQLIRSLYNITIEASNILQTDRTFRSELQTQIKQIAPNQIGKHGQLQEWLQDVDDPANKHRHVSHLWAVYPGNEITWSQDSVMMKAARQSLLYRGDAATGWSLGWKINLWARFQDGDHAYELIKLLLSPADKGGAGSYPNLFDAHPPFQIDGNFGGAAGIGELLVQSHTPRIQLLPALPTALATGYVKGIRARGGFEISMQWSHGKIINIDILSLAGNEAKLFYNGKVKIFETQKGKTYRLNGNLEMM